MSKILRVFKYLRYMGKARPEFRQEQNVRHPSGAKKYSLLGVHVGDLLLRKFVF
jgi:hypothetical protein